MTGYSMKWFVESQEQGDFKCPICYEVIRDAQSCTNGHAMCADCFRACPDRRCSVCRCDRVVSNVFIDRQIKRLVIRCPESCPWTGLLGGLGEHTKLCELHTVKCALCSEDVRATALAEHNAICPQRLVTCATCNGKHVHNVRHDCPQAPATCPHCGVQTVLSSLASHIDNDCPEKEIDCVYKRFGCNEKTQRRNVDEHLAARFKEHAAMVTLDAKLNIVSLIEPYALIRATRNHMVEQVDMLLKLGVHPDATDMHGDTALGWAAYLGYVDLVLMLIVAGANVNHRNRKGHTPVVEALQNVHSCPDALCTAYVLSTFGCDMTEVRENADRKIDSVTHETAVLWTVN